MLWAPSAVLVIDLLHDSLNFLNHPSSARIYISSQFCKGSNFLAKCWDNEPPRLRYGCTPSPALTPPLLPAGPKAPDLTTCLRIRPFHYTHQTVKCHTKIQGLEQTRSSWRYWRRLRILRFSDVSQILPLSHTIVNLHKLQDCLFIYSFIWTVENNEHYICWNMCLRCAK